MVKRKAAREAVPSEHYLGDRSSLVAELEHSSEKKVKTEASDSILATSSNNSDIKCQTAAMAAISDSDLQREIKALLRKRGPVKTA